MWSKLSTLRIQYNHEWLAMLMANVSHLPTPLMFNDSSNSWQYVIDALGKIAVMKHSLFPDYVLSLTSVV